MSDIDYFKKTRRKRTHGAWPVLDTDPGVFFRQWEQRSQGQGSRPGAWESSAPESLTPLLLAGEDLPVGAAEL